MLNNTLVNRLIIESLEAAFSAFEVKMADNTAV